MMERLPQRFCSPSELGNPQRTRVPRFPQRRRLRLSNWTQLLNPRKSNVLQILVQNHFLLIRPNRSVQLQHFWSHGFLAEGIAQVAHFCAREVILTGCFTFCPSVGFIQYSMFRRSGYWPSLW
jgi:hypothetical protein